MIVSLKMRKCHCFFMGMLLYVVFSGIHRDRNSGKLLLACCSACAGDRSGMARQSW